MHIMTLKEKMFCVDADIVDKVIGDMLFDLADEEECISKERALAMFKKDENTN